MRVLATTAIVGALFLIAFGLTTNAASAQTRSVYRGGWYVGTVRVEPGQIVDGDLTVFLGDADIDGMVNGNVNVIGGNIDTSHGVVNGQLHDVGGTIVDSLVPWAPDDGERNLDRDFGGYIRWLIALDVVAIVVFLIFPVRVRMALGRIEAHPGLTTAAGVVGWIAVIPVSVLFLFLALTVVLAPLIFVELVLVAVGTVVGTSALAVLIGRRFYESIAPRSTPTPMTALVLGLVLLTAAELVPVVGALVVALVALVGLGAAILTFVPDKPSGGTGVPPPRQTISGPPMPVA